MNKPSSTITAATLAGMAMSLVWGTVNEFTALQISPQYVALSVTFVSGLVGYVKKERVLKLENPDV